MGDITGGDLYSLWRVSDVLLPRVADMYYEANTSIGEGSGAFLADTPQGPGGSIMSSSCGAAWSDLRSVVVNILGYNETSINEACDGLRKARGYFVDADMASADALSKYRDANGDTGPESKPPKDKPGKPDMPDLPSY